MQHNNCLIAFPRVLDAVLMYMYLRSIEIKAIAFVDNVSSFGQLTI